MEAMSHPITTVLLDIDGTVLDTREFILAAFEHAFAHHELACPPRAELSMRVGEPLDAIYRAYCGELAAAFVESHRSFQKENLHLAAPFPGTIETLRWLREQGLVLAAVTSRSRRTSVESLEVAGVSEFFGAVVSAEDTLALKPDPAPLARALEMLGRTPEGAAMAGDTAADVVAGKALGMHTVAATYGFHGREVLLSRPDAVIEAIEELPEALGFAPANLR
jgi:pyrophosphatase PpaX